MLGRVWLLRSTLLLRLAPPAAGSCFSGGRKSLSALQHSTAAGDAPHHHRRRRPVTQVVHASQDITGCICDAVRHACNPAHHLRLRSSLSCRALAEQALSRERKLSLAFRSFAAAREASQSEQAAPPAGGGLLWPLLPPDAGTADQLYGALCLPEPTVSGAVHVLATGRNLNVIHAHCTNSARSWTQLSMPFTLLRVRLK